MNTLSLLAALTVFQVDPWFHKPLLPDADPEGGVVADSFSLAAAKGEFEAISFVVNPDRDLAKVDVAVSDLTGPGGAKIPGAAADVAIVKVWFHPAGRWNSSWHGNLEKPEALNTLVLHDDALLKVDFENKVNYLRGEYSDGVRYMNMSRRDIGPDFSYDLEPVRDAPKFVPFDLKKGFRQQYLVTWKVPKDARPGAYAGTIVLAEKGTRPVSTLKVALEVYPFSLPSPRTHYDTSRPYVSYWMGSPSLGRLLNGGFRLDRAERKLRAIFRSMADHNAVNLSGVGDFAEDSLDDYALRTLIIARQEGMRADPLINGMAFDTAGKFVAAFGEPTLEPEEHPEKYGESLAKFRKGVELQGAIMDKYLGHHRCYYSSLDECGPGTNRRSYGYWNIVHELGGKVWTDYAYTQPNGAFIDINDEPAHIDHKVNWAWHKCGARVVTYAAPFTGPENPDVWRRVKGLRFWYSDIDGQHEYAFCEPHRWNEFVYRGRYCQFGIVYFTMDGLISTLAWEAVRESLDDVRYFSLLRLRAEAALKSSDAATRALGRQALVWQDGVDPEYVTDLNAFRRETVGWIVKLIDKVGSQPEETDSELPPPSLPPDSRWKSVPKPSAGAKAIMAYADRMGGKDPLGLNRGQCRFDLALAALEGLLDDARAKASDRVRAAYRIAELHSVLKERPKALAALDKALAIKAISTAERGRLLLRRVKAQMTDEVFQEIYTAEHLDEAAKALTAALKYSGATEDERYGAIMRMASGYLAAQEYQRCIAFAEARLNDTRIDPAHRAYLHIEIAAAWKGLKEWQKALKSYDEAHRAFNNDKDANFRRKILLPEAEAAEQAKDYVRAVHCWTDLMPTYNEEEKDLYNRAKRNVLRLQPLARKDSKPVTGSMDDEDGLDGISLDE